MLNRALMGHWQNWVTVFLMISIVTLGFHSILILSADD